MTTQKMTHREAIESLSTLFQTQTEIAKHLDISQQRWSQIRSTGHLPKKYWAYVGAEAIELPKKRRMDSGEMINADDLTLAQARHLYNQLKEVFG
jgi:hypothetical protein